jgi:hypothetical protein
MFLSVEIKKKILVLTDIKMADWDSLFPDKKSVRVRACPWLSVSGKPARPTLNMLNIINQSTTTNLCCAVFHLKYIHRKTNILAKIFVCNMQNKQKNIYSSRSNIGSGMRVKQKQKPTIKYYTINEQQRRTQK